MVLAKHNLDIVDFWLFTVGRVADSAAPGFVLIVFISSFRSDLPSNHS